MTGVKGASFLMRFFDKIGLHSLAWSARRLYCPVKSKDLVLEVGSGGNPYFRSNVLLDAYEETRERHWVPLISDRPTVLGFVEHLPFRDKTFDFVIASHVLEHSHNPARFLDELQRIAKAGYIEVPDAFMERINPYRDHRLEITVRDGRLLIRKKPSWKIDSELVELYEAYVKPIMTREMMPTYPFNFHVRYYWEDNINYEVLNPEIDSSWPAPPEDVHQASLCGLRPLRQFLGRVSMKWIRAIFSQRHRNANMNLMEFLACPSCRSVELTMLDDRITCGGCGQTYSVRNSIPVMYPSAETDYPGL